MEEIIYRLAVDEDIQAINDFYNLFYKRDRDRHKFDWEFNSSPAGRAIYVIAEYQNKVVGTQCVIPYYVITGNNETILSGKSEDTLVSPDHRGKSIFEKMYALLLAECKKRNIEFIWGYTYAVKPFTKIGFIVPFKTKMGILVRNPSRAAVYFSSLSPKNTIVSKVKIGMLCFVSWLKQLMLFGVAPLKEINSESISFNTSGFNYLNNPRSFGLKLDRDFMDYRIYRNPYNKNYKICNYEQNNTLKASIVFNVTQQNIGYIVHVYTSESCTVNEFRRFLKAAIKNSDLNHCDALRFWGFSHNQQNLRELKLLTQAGFTFIDRGISFVWLPLNKDIQLNPENFVLSRMSSQGTD